MGKTKNNKNQDSEEYIVEETPKGSPLMFILNMGLILPLLLVAAAGVTRYILTTDFKTKCPEVHRHIQNNFPQKWTFESKVEVIFLAAVHIALYQLALAIFIMFFRIVFGRSNIKGQDTTIMNVINRAIQNTLEHGFIFLAVFGYWVLRFSTEQNSDLAWRFIMIFFVGRLTYVVGYVFAELTPFVASRGLGMGMTLNCHVLLITTVFGVNFIPIFLEHTKFLAF